MSRTLIECLKSSAKATQDAAEKVRVAQATAADPFQAERDAWAEWMTSANNQVPAHRYRQFQLETFTTFMRFVPLMQGIQQQPQQQPPKPPPQIVQPAVPLADPYNQQPMYLQPASLKPQQQPQQFITCITPPVRQQQQQPPQQLYEQLQPPRAVSAPPVTSATYDLSSLLALPSPLRLPASKGSNITEAAWQISSPANISLNTQSPAQRSRDSSLSQLLDANERDVTNEGPEDNTAELQREKEQEYEQE
ncbi:alpha/beta-gliadin A-V-like [Lytechinus variegatus]|nr:alpha/beta-gliadin A-V-like [Lytechinus variegatus]